jgi:DNA-binding NarL/FixJ family response regulator
MADGADYKCKDALKKLQFLREARVAITQIVTSSSISTCPKTLGKEGQLEVSLFGLSRKLLVLDALVRRNTDAFVGPDHGGNDECAQRARAKLAAGLLDACVLEIVAISKMQGSPIREITSDVLGQYNFLCQVPLSPSAPQERVKLIPGRLSNREREVVRYLAQCRSNKEIASALGLSVKTVETYRARIFIKLDARSLNDVFRFALRHKIIQF